MARLNHTQPLVYLDSAGQGGEGIVTKAFVEVAQKLTCRYTRYVLIPRSLQNTHMSKILWVYVRCLPIAVHIFFTQGKNPFLYSSHASSILIFMVLRFFGTQPVFCFHYHGTKVSRFTGVYKNYFKRLFMQILHKFLMTIERTIEHAALTQSTYICVPTIQTSTALSSQVTRQYFVLPSFYDPTVFDYQKKSHSSLLKVAFVGRISFEKGIITLARSLSATQRTWETFFLTTQSNYNQHLLPLLMEYIPAHKLCCVNDPTHDDIAEMLHTVDCVFLPSESEHFPLIMLESLATGTPFFAPPVGNCKEILESIDSNLVLEQPLPQSITQKLLWLYSLSNEKRTELAMACYRAALPFTHASFDRHVRNFLLH